MPEGVLSVTVVEAELLLFWLLSTKVIAALAMEIAQKQNSAQTIAVKNNAVGRRETITIFSRAEVSPLGTEYFSHRSPL